jgi:hypothetical protein
VRLYVDLDNTVSRQSLNVEFLFSTKIIYPQDGITIETIIRVA